MPIIGLIFAEIGTKAGAASLPMAKAAGQVAAPVLKLSMATNPEGLVLHALPEAVCF